MNQIVKEIDIQEREKPTAGEIFFTAFVTVCIQIMNQIMNEIEIQKREKPAAGEIFYNISYSCKHTINEIMSESEIQEHSMPVAGELFLEHHHNINIINTKRLYLAIAD